MVRISRPQPPFRMGFHENSLLGELLKVTQLLIHGFVSGYSRWGLSGEVAEDPVFEDGID